MLHYFLKQLFGAFAVTSPLWFGGLLCLFIWRKRRFYRGNRPNGLVWLSSTMPH